MRTRSDPRFGEIIEPRDITEIVDLAVCRETSPVHVRMWRGQADEKWLLDSGCVRMLRLSGNAPTERSVSYHERWLLDRATHRGYRFINGRDLSDFELLARLQHHGAATRLLDAARSILVGLYFACATEPDRPGLLFGISSNELGGGEGNLLTGTYEAIISQVGQQNHPQTWDPPAVSPRVAAQHSQFVYSKVEAGRPHGSLALDAAKALMVFAIPAEMKNVYLRHLRAGFDVSAETLFPDIEGFCEQHSHRHRQFSTSRW